MFGCLVSGQLVRTDFSQIEPNKYVLNLSDGSQLKHVVVFLLKPTLPSGYAATVYLYWSDPSTSWQLLGMLSNEKPSAIFKISRDESARLDTEASMDMTMDTAQSVQIGISIESLDTVQRQLSDAGLLNLETGALVLRSDTAKEARGTAQAMLQNFYNYAASFTTTWPAMSGIQPSTSPQPYIPLRVLEDWYRTTERRLNLDPHYFKSMPG